MRNSIYSQHLLVCGISCNLAINNMERRDEQFQQLSTDIAPFKALLRKASDGVLDQDISKYPIFISGPTPIVIGIELSDSTEQGDPFYINISTLEDLAVKGIVEMSKVKDFTSVFKDPRTHFCFLVPEGEMASFVFIPA